jgi:methyl-accepting chemotaxis protein
VEEASAAAQALTEQASNLTQLISRYQVGEGSADEAPRAVARPTPSAATRVERRAPTRSMTGKKRPASIPTAAAPARSTAPGGDEQWKEF